MFSRRKGAYVQFDPGHPEDAIVRQAVRVLSDGGVIAFPTDTVYGLGCRADSAAAVRRIYRIKGRERSKPLVLMVRDEHSLPGLTAGIAAPARRLVETFWPGPLTLVFTASDTVRRWKLDKIGTVGIRQTAEPVVNAILKAIAVPLATTSANASGCPESRSGRDAARNLKQPVDLILDGGPLAVRAPSTVLDVSGARPIMLRKGAVSRAALETVLQTRLGLATVDVMFVCTGNTCRSPMAEAFLRLIMPRVWRGRVTVHSSGTGALPGMPATGSAIAVARREGCGIETHRAALLTDRLIREADLVVAMEERHRQAIRNLALESAPVLLSPDGVPDPIGGGKDEYQRTLDIIKQEMPDIVTLIREMLA